MDTVFRIIEDGKEKFISAETGQEVSQREVAKSDAQVQDADAEEIKKILPRGEGNAWADHYNADNNPDASNNFGFYDKPKVMELASLVPGLPGMVAKGVNTAMNARNVHGVNKAREYLGLEDNGVGKNIKGLVKDNRGYVADVKFNENPNVYSVGLGALDRDKRTQMTPDEARKRGLLAGGLTEATPDERKQNIKEYKQDLKGMQEESALGPYQPEQNVYNLKDKQGTKPSANHVALHGLGLGEFANTFDDPDLPTRDMAQVNYDLENKGRSQVPTSGIGNKVSDVVTDVLGSGYSVNVTSGQEPEGHKAVGTAHRHPQGYAADLDIRDPSGRKLDINNPQDAQQIHDVAQGMAARYDANFGMGKEYMGANTMHIDTMPLDAEHPGGPQWASLGQQWAGDLDNARATKEMPGCYYDRAVENGAPTPETRPNGRQLDDSLARGFANPGQMDPGRFDNDTRTNMAMTLAGEIDLSKTDLNSDIGKQEAMGILSTMDNRASKYGSISAAIQAPKQYSTWNNAASTATAKANYNANKGAYDSLVSTYAGAPEQYNTGFTSYHANTVSPEWSSSMKDATTIGPHTFGSLPEYASAGTVKTADNLVGPKTAFNTSASFTPNVTGTVSTPSIDSQRQSMGLMSSPTAMGSNRPASNDTSKSTNDSSRSGFASSPMGASATKTTTVSTGGGWGQRSSSGTQSKGARDRSDGEN
jgi:hypothetical protein